MTEHERGSDRLGRRAKRFLTPLQKYEIWRRCCIHSGRGALKHRPRTESDDQSEFVERDGQPPDRWFLHGQFVVTPPKVLDERVPRDDHPGAAVLLEPSHRSQPRLQAAVVGLDR